MSIYLSLGSNEGDRISNLNRALLLLKEKVPIQLCKVSSYYETEPWGLVEQELFINIAVEISTALQPLELLQICQEIENNLGRKRTLRWGPRTIDIDILLYHNFQINTEQLKLPHPFMEVREFVLAPLREIAPDLLLPSGKYVKELKGEGKVKKISFYSN